MYFLPHAMKELLKKHYSDIEDQTLSFVAHDRKEKEIVEFVTEHFDFLDRFGRRIATGATGSLLHGPGIEWVKERIRPTQKLLEKLHLVGDWISLQPRSGPCGRDVQIADFSLEGRHQKVLLRGLFKTSRIPLF